MKRDAKVDLTVKTHTSNCGNVSRETRSLGHDGACPKSHGRWLTRTNSSRFGVALFTFLGVVACGPAEQPTERGTISGEGVLLQGGLVVDGSGEAARIADVLIVGDRIASVTENGDGDLGSVQVIDASGLVVAPGFIDPHTHALPDLSDMRQEGALRRRNDNYLLQGVTTVFVGNDGAGSYEVARSADSLESIGIGPNVGFFVGLGAVRTAVIGEDDRRATDDELADMAGLVERAMCEGAIGLSTGLHYAPQAFASTEEVITLAKVAARYGGVYDSHIRDESNYSVGLLASIKEAISIGEAAGLPVHIAHIKALGPEVWGMSNEVIELIEQSQARGLAITADQYPWRASGTNVANALVPRWAMDGGMEGLRKRFKDPNIRPALLQEMRENLVRRAGADALLLTVASGGNPDEWVGMTLAELASQNEMEPIEQAVEILLNGNFSVASFVMDPDDIKSFSVRPWVMTGSDGVEGHPRKYGSFPKAYEDLVLGESALSLPEFIRRSSALAADTFSLKDRGYVREGNFADLVVFDADNYRSQASYGDPGALASGVEYLFVNGDAAVFDGEVQDVFAGRALLKEQPKDKVCAQ